jgi:hypothetical protein
VLRFPGLACLAFLSLVFACPTDNTRGAALPRRGPVINGGDERTLEQSLSHDLLSKASILAFSPSLPACLPPVSPWHWCILPNIASLGFSHLVHIELVWDGQEKSPTTATGTPAVQKEGHGRGDAEVVVPACELSLLRPRHAMRPAVLPLPPAGWARQGVVCLRGRRAVAEVAPTTLNQCVTEEPQAGAAAAKQTAPS